MAFMVSAMIRTPHLECRRDRARTDVLSVFGISYACSSGKIANMREDSDSEAFL
jgi:hypothetical protein